MDERAGYPVEEVTARVGRLIRGHEDDLRSALIELRKRYRLRKWAAIIFDATDAQSVALYKRMNASAGELSATAVLVSPCDRLEREARALGAYPHLHTAFARQQPPDTMRVFVFTLGLAVCSHIEIMVVAPAGEA